MQLGERLEVMRLTLENCVERTRSFACCGERTIKRPKARAYFFQCDREIHAIAHDLPDLVGNRLEVAEFLPVFHRLQCRLKLQAGAEHVGQLFGEEHHLLALELDRTFRNRRLIGLRRNGRCLIGFWFRTFSRSMGNSCRLAKVDRLQPLAIEHAQGLWPVHRIKFAARDGTLGVESFVSENRHDE